MVVILSGCTSSLQEVEQPPTELSTQAVHNAEDVSWTLDSQFVEVSRSVPGFGGAFYDEEGNVNVYLVGASEKSNRTAVKADIANALVDVFGESVLTEIRTDDASNVVHPDDSIVFDEGYIIAEREIKILQADYDFATLAQWRRQLDDYVFQIPSVISTDIDDANNRILIGVDDEAAIKEIEAIAERLALPSDALTFEVDSVELMTRLDDRVRPIVGGLQIDTNPWTCTLGFNVRRLASSTYGFITNTHCSSTAYGFDGQAFYQGLFGQPGDLIGHEAYDPTPFVGGACPSGQQCRYSDSTFIEYNSTASAENAFAVTKWGAGLPGNNAFEIERNEEFDWVNATSSPNWVGVSLRKVGRSTGMTGGNVTNSCVNVRQSDYDVLLLCQVYSHGPVSSGDSGSPVFSSYPNLANPGSSDMLYGILWGKREAWTGKQSFVFSPYSGIESDLGMLTIGVR